MVVLQRVFVLLTALVLLLGTAMTQTASARPLQGGAAIARVSNNACSDCAHDTAGGAKMMPCGALACAGCFVALPAAAAWHLPVSVAFEYGPVAAARTSGIARAPDPFPPRSTFLA